jgi:hypothetical protein
MRTKEKFIFLLFGLFFMQQADSQTVKFTELIANTRIELLPGSADFVAGNSAFGSMSTLMRLNSQGAVVWAKQYPADTFQLMKVMPDKGALLIGTKKNAVVIVRTDSSGNVSWAKNYNTSYLTTNWSAAVDIRPITGFDLAADGSFLVCAQQSPQPNPPLNRFFVFSADANGNLKWARGFKGTGPGNIQAGPALFNSANSFTGTFSFSFQNGSNSRIGAVGYRSDSLNPLAWSKLLLGSNYVSDFARSGNNYILLADSGNTVNRDNMVMLDSALNQTSSMCMYDNARGLFQTVKRTSDGGYILAGWSISFNNPLMPQAILVKTDSQMHAQWARSYGRVSMYSLSSCKAGDVCETTDHGFIVPAEKYLFKTDNQGRIGCEDSVLTPTFIYSGSNPHNADPSLPIAVDTITIHVSSLTVVPVNVSVLPSIECLSTGIEEKPELVKMNVFPNPFSEKLQVKYELEGSKNELQVYTMLGKLIYTQQLIGSSTEINTAEWTPGLYFVCIHTGKQCLSQKILKQ